MEFCSKVGHVEDMYCVVSLCYKLITIVNYHLESCYSYVFGKRNYRVIVRVSVFLHNNSKRNRSRNTKLEYIAVYENSSGEFDIELRRIKVKVTVSIQKCFPIYHNTNCQVL